MKLEVADVVRGSETPAIDGVTGAMRCVIALANGMKRAAYLKSGSPEDVRAECFCSLLFREWGLDVPEPFLIRLPHGLGFACAEANYPSLKQRVGLLNNIPEGPLRSKLELIACGVVATFNSTPLALCADEAVGNFDRNLGNILWDGYRATWIDHAMCLRQVEAHEERNLLAIMATIAGKADDVSKSAVAQALTLNRTVVEEAGAATSSMLGCKDPAEFVAKRITTLATRIIARFPAPADLLSTRHD